MIHLTLNSGKSVRDSKQVLSPELGEVIRTFFDNGGGVFPSPYHAYRIETDVAPTGVAFYFFKGDDIISTCSGTWSAEAAHEYWAQIEKQYYDITDVFPKCSWAKRPPKMPASVPWLATLLQPEFFIHVKSDSPDVSFLNVCEVGFFLAAQEYARS